MLSRSKYLLLPLCLALFLGGCGYGLGSDADTVLKPIEPGVLPTVKIKSVENPTLYPWLSYVIRSEIRDELAARKIARWVDSGKADYELALKVTQFTFRTWITNAQDATMLYDANLTMEAILYQGSSNKQVWSSLSSYNQTYDTVQERTAASDLVRELVRRTVLAMRQSF